MHSQEHNLPQHLQDNEHYIIAHMSPLEIEELSKVQGGKILDPGTGYPSFMPLGEIFAHKRMAPYIDNFKRDYMAQNGNMHQGLEAAIRRSGRYGDTEAVVLPRHLADIFDQLLYGGKQPGNPETGKREYFLGGFLNSIGNAFKPLTNFLSSGIGSISPMINKIGSGIADAGSKITNALFNTDPASIPSVTQQAFAKAAPALANIASPLISQGASALAQRAGVSPEMSQNIGETIGNTAGGLLNNLGQSAGGEGAEGATGATPPTSSLDLLKQGAGSLLQKALPTIGNMASNKASQLAERIRPGMGTQVGQIAQGLVNNVGGNVAQSLQGGQTPTASGMGNAALDTMTGYARENLGNIQNPMARMAGEGALNTLGEMRGGASPLEALRSGVSNISPETMSGAQNYATSGISDLLNSILPEAEQALPMAEEALPLLA